MPVVRPHTVTIASVRIYFYPRSKALEGKLSASHWGFAEWFTRRLKPIREQLRGPEVKGVNIMNLMLHENPSQAWRPNVWAKRANSLQYSFVCNLRPLEHSDPVANLSKLMVFYAAVATEAPWPQARAVASALAAPLTDVDQVTLRPYLQWPRGTHVTEAQARRALRSAA